MEMPVSEQVFHSLIFGHSKLGDFESADRVMVIMQDTGLECLFDCLFMDVHSIACL